MTEIADLERDIKHMQDNLQRDMDNLHKKDPSQRMKQINRCQNKLAEIRTRVEAYELEILQFDRNTKNTYQETFKTLQDRYKNLKKELDKKKMEKVETESRLVTEEDTTNRNIDDMDAQTLIKHGEKVQQQGKDALDRIKKNVISADQKADHITMELHRQKEVTDRARDKAKDVQSELKKSKSYLRYFARQVYTDKILMCLIFLSIIAIIVIIILRIAKDKGMTTPQDVINKVTNN